ncbi:MAG: site-specific integrase, partial [Polyangia bacterium]
VAAMMTLILGLRASEVVTRTVRDVDDDGSLLWIPSSKTDAGRRTVRIPTALRDHMLRLVKGRDADDLLFGRRWRDWPRKWVQRICSEAGVMKVSAHGMRGLHSTLAVDSGITGHAVAAALGHESFSTTTTSYARPEAVSNARQQRVLAVLDGGKK